MLKPYIINNDSLNIAINPKHTNMISIVEYIKSRIVIGSLVKNSNIRITKSIKDRPPNAININDVLMLTYVSFISHMHTMYHSYAYYIHYK